MVVPVVEDMSMDFRSAEAGMVDDEARRLLVWKYLEVGLVTEVEPRADDQQAVQDIVSRLKSAGKGVVAKMTIAGFYEAPVEHDGIDQSCETCVYFQVHRRYCEMPEIDLPVEPHWSCRLWRM
jgi:hypothetical protein